MWCNSVACAKRKGGGAEPPPPIVGYSGEMSHSGENGKVPWKENLREIQGEKL